MEITYRCKADGREKFIQKFQLKCSIFCCALEELAVNHAYKNNIIFTPWHIFMSIYIINLTIHYINARFLNAHCFLEMLQRFFCVPQSQLNIRCYRMRGAVLRSNFQRTVYELTSFFKQLDMSPTLKSFKKSC